MLAAVAALLMAGGIPAASPALAGAGGEAAELENARGNARAGGPLSERDKELLERYGCLSGTNNDFCRKLENRSYTRPVKRRKPY